MRIIRRLATEERGVTIVLVAFMLLVLLGMAAMAVDVGELLWTRRALQNAVDAAALAGVRELPENPSLAQQTALRYAAANGFSNASGEVTVTTAISTIFNANDALVVTATRTVPPLLRWAVSSGNIDVPARAVAVVAKVWPECDIWPWGIEQGVWLYDDYKKGITTTHPFSETYGQKVVLKVPSPTVPGNFLAIDLETESHGGARTYEDAIKYGGCFPDKVLATKTGNMVGPTEQGVIKDVDSAILQSVPCYDPKKNPNPPPDNVYWQVSETNPYSSGGLSTTLPFGLGCPCTNDASCGCAGPPSSGDPFPEVTVGPCARVGIIPILAPGSYDACNGTCKVTVVDFAAFYLIGLEKDQGNQAYVVGAFLKRVDIEGTPQWGKPLDGPRTYVLWE